MKSVYEKGNHIVYRCVYHVILSTKYRIRVLVGKVKMRLYDLIYNKQDDYNYRVIKMKAMPNHIHMLMRIKPTDKINIIIGKLKGYTSKILRNEYRYLNKYPSLWTRAKFVSSIGVVSEDIVMKYIKNQWKNAIYKKSKGVI